jgi:YD repeat-containing protein
MNPLGGQTQYQYDPETLCCISEVGPAGRETVSKYDSRGRLIGVSTTGIEPISAVYDDVHDLPRQLVHGNVQWAWSYDEFGQVVSQDVPDVGRYRSEWRQGLLTVAEGPGGARAKITHDDWKNIVLVRFADGAETRNWFDGLGRLAKRRDGRGRTTEFVGDTEGNLIEVRTSGGTWRMRYDAEGCLQAADNGSRHIV